MNALSASNLVLCLLLFVSISKTTVAGLIRDTELETGIQDLAAPLIKAAGYAPNSIDFRIILNINFNAFVAGEQVIYLNSGLLLEAQSAEEILGVIAHELGHLKAGHVPRRDETLRDAGRAGTLAALAAIALAAGGVPNDAAMGLVIGGSDQAKRKMLRSFRYDEAVADELGLNYLNKAGITSTGLVQMMRRMAAQRALPENRQSQYYRTHPGTAQRLLIYEDNTKQTSHQTTKLPIVKQQLMNRLVNKLRAYSEPAQTILNKNDSLDDPNRQYGHAIAYYRRGDLESAYQLMDTLAQAVPNDPFYREFMGDILLSMAKPDAAAAAYEEALELRPNSPQIQLNLGRALIAVHDKSRLQRAIEVITLAKNSEPKWAFIHRQLAIAYGRAGKIALADLSLAEEAILVGNEKQAMRLAKRVLKQTNLSDDLVTRAKDIVFRFGKASE
ncbi:M48 family metalloprotease [Candidatus Puniceispirillum sp.]|nr:M48 family metalloprotease [Candidatus Puniceispirillum sp.]